MENSPIAFRPYPKTPRLFNSDIVITEKLDGTNGCIIVTEEGEVSAGSRKRAITPEQDNYGFARWVQENAAELQVGLGPGVHYGEWWGAGIQRRYGMDKKVFSLFNAGRWTERCFLTEDIDSGLSTAPACCCVVPILFRGLMSIQAIATAAERLSRDGSVAAPGFMDPEGLIIFHEKSEQVFKFTLNGDGAKDNA